MVNVGGVRLCIHGGRISFTPPHPHSCILAFPFLLFTSVACPKSIDYRRRHLINVSNFPIRRRLVMVTAVLYGFTLYNSIKYINPPQRPFNEDGGGDGGGGGGGGGGQMGTSRSATARLFQTSPSFAVCGASQRAGASFIYVRIVHIIGFGVHTRAHTHTHVYIDHFFFLLVIFSLT